MPNCDPDDYVGICSSAADPVIVSPIAGGAGGLTNTELRASAVPVSVAAGADVTLGNTTDAAVDTDTTGTASGKLRGIVKLLVNLLSRWPAALSAGGGLKVGVVDALPAGTAAIGKLAANSGVDIGDVDVTTLPAYATVATGEIAGATSATQNPSVACREVTLKAEYDNVGRVYIGVSGVTKADGSTDTTTGIQLSAGESITLPITNLNLTYRICDNTGDDLTYIALT